MLDNTIDKHNLKNVIKNFEKNNIDKGLLKTILYLVEWKYILVNNKRLFNVNWFKSNFSFLDFNVMDSINPNKLHDYANLNELNDFTNQNIELLIEDNIKEYFDFILNKYKRFKYTGIMNLAFSTYPMIKGELFEVLDLIKYREEYLKILNKKEFKSITNLKELKR